MPAERDHLRALAWIFSSTLWTIVEPTGMDAQRHRVAWLHVASNWLPETTSSPTDRRAAPGCSSARRRVLHQRDEGRAIRIVLDALDLGRHVELVALEIDDAIGLLVAAAAEPHGDTAGVVAAAGRGLALGQGLDRLALVERPERSRRGRAWRRLGVTVG